MAQPRPVGFAIRLSVSGVDGLALSVSGMDGLASSCLVGR